MRRLLATSLLALAFLAGCATSELDQPLPGGSLKLGIVFSEGGKPKPIVSTRETATVRLTGLPVAILVPTTERAIQICASASPAIFSQSLQRDPPCFVPGTGMAMPPQDPSKGWPLLLTAGEGHHYFDLSRTVNGNRYRAIHIRQIEGPAATRTVYLTVFIDRNGDRQFDRDEFEHFALEFERDVVTVSPSGNDAKQAAVRSYNRSDEEIQRVFASHAKDIYRMYRDELRKTPTLQGQLVLQLTIAPTGAVDKCTVVSSELNHPRFERELVERIKRIDFGAKAGTALTIWYPIDFLPR